MSNCFDSEARLNLALNRAVTVLACLELLHPASTSPCVIPSIRMASDTTELVDKALPSATDVPLSVAPRQTRHGGSVDSRERISQESVRKELVSGLKIIDTTPCVVVASGIFRRRLPDASMSVLLAEHDENHASMRASILIAAILIV